MKITKIEIKHFRGFPRPAVYTFDLPGGKDLLLYGENGSGKSPLYHALNQLFNIDVEPPAFSASLFGKEEKQRCQLLEEALRKLLLCRSHQTADPALR